MTVAEVKELDYCETQEEYEDVMNSRVAYEIINNAEEDFLKEIKALKLDGRFSMYYELCKNGDIIIDWKYKMALCKDFMHNQYLIKVEGKTDEQIEMEYKAYLFDLLGMTLNL